ncbi:hypothetical protein [Francisella halioticida]|uniref:hypothetical protein n=1 Tax=Francisella halioticida TaxID=549298 RepID=UPI001FE86DA1|nr:hypothetical protein [Francisella halioticida]
MGCNVRVWIKLYTLITVCLEVIFPDYSKALITFISCLVMFIATVNSGLKSIIQIDKVSFILSSLLFIFFGIYFYKYHQQGIQINIKSHTSLPILFTLSLVILTCFTYILSPWYGQNIFSAKSPKVAFYSMLVTAILVSLFYVIAIFITASFSKQLALNNPDLALASIVARKLPLVI